MNDNNLQLLLERAAMGRVKLGIPEGADVVYYACQPDQDRLPLLSRVGRALAGLKRAFPHIALVVSPMLDNEAYKEALGSIKQAGVRVAENGRLYLLHQAGRPMGCCPSSPASAGELLSLCAVSGLILVGSGEGSKELTILVQEMIVPHIIYRGESVRILRRRLRNALVRPEEWIGEAQDATGVQENAATPLVVEKT